MNQTIKKTETVEIVREFREDGDRVIKRYMEPGALMRAQIHSEIEFHDQHCHPWFVSLLEHREEGTDVILEYTWFDGLPLDLYLHMHPQDALHLWERLFHLVRWLRYHDLFIGDLKPAHVLVRHTADGPEFRIIDLTPHKTRLTPDWAAPEQSRGVVNWKSNLFSCALFFAAAYSSPGEVKDHLQSGRPLLLPPECPLGEGYLRFLHPEPTERADDLDALVDEFRHTNPPMQLPCERSYSSYLEFHQGLCDLFYTKAISCWTSFELYDRFCLPEGLRRPGDLNGFVVPANHTLPLSDIAVQARLDWQGGRLELGLQRKEKAYRADSMCRAIADMRDALDEWRLDDSRRVWAYLHPLCQALTEEDEAHSAEFLALSIHDFIWLHRYIIVRDFTLADSLMKIMLAGRSLDLDDRGRLHYYLLQVNAISSILPLDLVSITEAEIDRLEPELKRSIMEYRELRVYYDNRDLAGMQRLYRERELLFSTTQALYLFMDILYPHCPDDFDTDIFRAISERVARETEPNFLINLMTRARAHLNLPESFLEYFMLLSLKVDSAFQLSRVLFYMLSNTGKEDMPRIEQVLLFYDDLPLASLPRVMVTHLTVIRIYYYLLREQYGLCRELVRETIGQSHGYATCYMLQIYLECSFLDHEFTFDNTIEAALEANAEDIASFYPMREVRYLLLHFAGTPQIERYCRLFGWNRADSAPRCDYQRIIQLWEEGRWRKLIKLAREGGFDSRHERAESFYWGGLALEKNGQVQLAFDYLRKAREMFAGMGLERRAAQAADVLDQWERMRQKLNRSSWQDIIEKFSQFTELEPFLAEMESLFQHLFRFEMVIPFLYDAEAERFISLRQASGESAENYRALEYSNNVLQLYKKNVFRVLRFSPADSEGNESVQSLGIYSALCVPVVVGRRLLGTIYMHTANSDHTLAEDDVSSIESLASILGVFLEKLNQTETQKRLRVINLAEDFHGFVGRSTVVAEVIRQAVTLARVPFPLLITGETGTGKEILARALYLEGGYRGKMICLNINTVPHELFESELFGHVKGAFTGAASDSSGKVALAADGLLFLDEIGDLSPDMQTKLLRVLQERTYYPVGGKHEMHTNARFVFATNRDLRRAVAEGAFREDLYYRISSFCIQIPPLRERPADIPLLVRFFTRKFLQIQPEIVVSPIPDGVVETWRRRDWRGNIRELENQVYKALLMPQSEQEPERREVFGLRADEVKSVDDVVAAYLLWRKDQLGSAKAVMQELGLPRSTFYRLAGNKKD